VGSIPTASTSLRLKRSVVPSYGSARLFRKRSAKRRLPRRSHAEAHKGEGGRRRAVIQATARYAFLDWDSVKFYYVYILQSESDPKRFYTGFTEGLDSRLNSHNSGQVPHTSKYKPWRVKTVIAFTDRKRASDFETYLKSASGRAFSKKRL